MGTIRGVTSGERFKKDFYCGVYEVISLRKWPSSYDWGCLYYFQRIYESEEYVEFKNMCKRNIVALILKI